MIHRIALTLQDRNMAVYHLFLTLFYHISGLVPIFRNKLCRNIQHDNIIYSSSPSTPPHVPWIILAAIDIVVIIITIYAVGISGNSMVFSVGVNFHGMFTYPKYSMEPSLWPRKLPWNPRELSDKFHGIPGNYKYWYMDEYHDSGSIFRCLLHDFMLSMH